MIAPAGSKGDAGPTSTTKPLSFSVLFHVTVVPTFTQKGELPFAFGMLGVLEAESAVRFTSTVQGVEADPHVVAAVHSCAGVGSEQAYLLLFDWAFALLSSMKNVNAIACQPTTNDRRTFIMHPAI